MLSNLSDLPIQQELTIVPVSQSWGWLKGIIEQGEQIPVNKELLAQQRAQIGQGPAEAGAELQIFQHQHSDQCCPNLRLQRIGRGSHESLHPEQLFQGLEKRLNLPAILVDGSYCGGSPVEMG
jgi:hypothetical protein